MNACIAFLTLILFSVALVLRWLATRKAITPFDSYFYMLSTREVSRQRVGIAGELELALTPPQRVAVPYLMQALFGMLPDRVFARLHGLIGPLADALFATLCFHLTLAAGFSEQVGLWTFALYVSSPAMFSRIAIGPRVSSFTPRLFSEIAGNLFFIVMLMPLGLTPIAHLMLGAGLAAAILLLSKFGLQVLLFVTPLIGLVLLDARPVVAAMLGLALAVVVTGGRCIASFRAQLHHLSAYAVRNFRGETMISNRNSLAQLKLYLGTKRAIDSRAGKILFYVLSTNSFTCVLLKFTVAPLALGLVVWQWVGQGVMVPLLLLAPLVSTAIIYVAINIPALLFLGEAERYLYHVAYFFMLSTVVLAEASGLPWLPAALTAAGMAYWCVETFLLPRVEQGARDYDDDAQNVLNQLRLDPVERRIALYPYTAIGVWRVLYETKHRVLYPTHLEAAKRREFARFEVAYPYLNLAEFSEIADIHDLDMLIVEANAPQSPALVLPAHWELSAIRSERFIIYHRAAIGSDNRVLA